MVVQLEAKIFEAIDKNDKKGTTLMLGIQSSIIALAVHPKKDILAIAGDKGWIMLWDYVKKDAFPGQSYENYSKESRDKGKERGKKEVSYTCMEFTPDGEQLLIATTEGRIRIFDPDTAREFNNEKMSTDDKYDGTRRRRNYQSSNITVNDSTADDKKSIRIEQMIISEDGTFMATSDSKNCVCLFKYGHLFD